MVKAAHFLSEKIAKKRRRVTFAKGCNEIEVGFQVKYIPSTSNVSAQDKQRMHCTKEEKKNMKKMAREVADEVYDADNDNPLNPPNNANAYTPSMLRAFESCRHNSTSSLTLKDDLQSIIHWVTTDPSRRGLEKLSVNGLSTKMGTYRRTAIQTVIDMHAIAMANHGYLSRATQDSISTTYSEFSDPSKKFAALMGLVDEKAAAQLETRRGRHRRTSSPTSVLVIVDPMISDSSSQVEFFELSDPMTSSMLGHHTKEVCGVDRVSARLIE